MERVNLFSTLRLHSVSGQAAFGQPPVKQVDVRLRPGAIADRRRRRHDSATNSADPIVDGVGVGFHSFVVGEVERPSHPLNVAFGEQRKDIHFEARFAIHCVSYLRLAALANLLVENLASQQRAQMSERTSCRFPMLAAAEKDLDPLHLDHICRPRYSAFPEEVSALARFHIGINSQRSAV
jgi:hypothetical protein